GRAFCYAWNDFQRRQPTIGYLAELIGAGDQQRAQAVVHRLLSSGPLLRGRLVVIGALPEGQEPPLLGRTVQLATRVVLHLQGATEPDERLGKVCRLLEPELSLDRLVLPQPLVDRVCTILLHTRSAAGLSRLLLTGPPGTGKKALVGAIALEMGRRLLVLDIGRLWEHPEVLGEQLRRAFREANLQNALPYLEMGEGVPDDGVPWWLASVVGEAIGDYYGRVIIGSTERPVWLLRCIPNLQEVTIPFPGTEDRFLLWQRALPQKSYLSRNLDLKEVAHQFVLSGGGIRRAAEEALERARHRSRSRPTIRYTDLVEVCSAQLQHRLSTLAHRVASGFTWEDMILEQETQEALEEMLSFARHKRFILHDWGFRSKVPYGAGLSCLFSGPPGTGKTMAASIIARELGMELFRIDLSRVVNKYIGETEKNLGRIFDEARESNAVLLFDEADSLFSKRTDVRSSVDRYANLEVNYLLQRMEDHEGVTLLTTNMEASLDEAFKRRLKFRIHFPFPDGKARARLWRIMIPRQAAIEEGIDWVKLGGEFEMSGGHIKNAVLRAAILAASEGRSIAMEHLRRAGLQEYREMGKLVLS
ncbi:MAG: ATP-binding protein, partial [Deltaproteobacteria bacterium]|nr:ATP-binding protein [Deltaproteobacteria bacterium]